MTHTRPPAPGRLHPARLLSSGLVPALVLGALAVSGSPASAVGRSHPAARPPAAHTSAGQHLHARKAGIDLTGVVLSHTSHSARVVVSGGRVGATHVKPQVLTVMLAGRGKGSATTFRHRLVNGYQLHLKGVGSVSNSVVRLGAVSAEQLTVTTSQAWFGVVQTYDPATHIATVQLLRDGLGGDGGPDGHGDVGQTISLDVSAAAVTTDGVTGGTLAAGDQVVALGEASGLTVAATTVFAYSAAPVVVGGEITNITDTVATVGGHEDAAPVTVDLGSGATAVPVILNGTGGYGVADLSVGDHLLVLGMTDGTGAFVAQVAIAFNEDDHGPCGDNGNEHRGRGHDPVPADVSAALTDAAAYLTGGVQDGNVTGTGSQTVLPADGANPLPATSTIVTDVRWDVAPSVPTHAELCIAASTDGIAAYHYEGHIDGSTITGEIHPGNCD
jgi:hypothetical protein